jgi:hypothetical protein
MKTSTFFSVLSLALIFTLATSAFAGNISTKGTPTPNNSIRYQVNVQMSSEKPLNTVYLIQIFNENHKLVAPAQMLVPGKTQYSFFEKGPADGIRIAVIVKAASGMGGAEPNATLVTEPAVVKGPFEVGHTYRFDLFPKLQGAKE